MIQRIASPSLRRMARWNGSSKVNAIHDASVLPNGNILLQQGWTKIIEVTPEKETAWEYDSGEDERQ